MFNIGPFELAVLAIVGLIVLGPERLPGLAREAASMLRTLRDLATGAREQLRDELGPEFADVDLRTLNPRTAVRRAVFGDEFDDFDPRGRLRDAVFGDEDLQAADPRKTLRETREDMRWNGSGLGAPSPGLGVAGDGQPKAPPVDMSKPMPRLAAETPASPRPRPRPSPRPRTSYDDVT